MEVGLMELDLPEEDQVELALLNKDDDVVISFNDKETRLVPLAKLEKRVNTRQAWTNIWYGSSSLMLLATISVGIFLLYYLATQRRSLRNVYEAEMDESLAAFSNKTFVRPTPWGDQVLSCAIHKNTLSDCGDSIKYSYWRELYHSCVKAFIPFCQAKSKRDAGTRSYDGGIAGDVIGSILLLIAAAGAIFHVRKWKYKLLDKPVATFLPAEIDSLKYALDMYDLTYSDTESVHSAIQRINIEREKEKRRTAFLGIGYLPLAEESAVDKFKALHDVVRSPGFDRAILGKIFEYADMLPANEHSLKSVMAWGHPIFHRDSRVINIDVWLFEKNNPPVPPNPLPKTNKK